MLNYIYLLLLYYNEFTFILIQSNITHSYNQIHVYTISSWWYALQDTTKSLEKKYQTIFLYYFTSSQNSIREFSIQFFIVSIHVLHMVGQNFFRLPLLLILLHSLFPFNFFAFFFFFGLLSFSNSFISFIKTSSILVLSSEIRLRIGLTIVFLKCWMIFFICRIFLSLCAVFVCFFVLLKSVVLTY